ncbi:AMP-binding protein [Amnibacterium sp. CER49]|uniref:AMP-binding protein n=1 Tax=Amnibacterium sp. CER49 TaxID=3039161 RepID=UPI00244D6669|nr:AMP-binding protein [Amnibacterium sp. CER49]MDH2443413.1 AMP-binding protein [Amnibacterium sp. CER49]
MRDLEVVPAGDPAPVIAALRAAVDGSGPAVLPLAPDAARPAGLPDRVPVRVALVIATSGSSGAPKLVALSASALLASAAATEGVLGGPGGWVLALPTHYIAGVQVVVRALAAGTEPVVVPPGPFTASAFAAAVASLPADRRRYSALVPTQLHRVVEAVENREAEVAAACRALDAVLIGGGRLSAPLAERARAAGMRVVRTYGASETAGGCVYDGVPLAGVRVAVVDGEVLLAGPMLAEGYLGDDARTARAFLDEPGVRWYRTGDAGEWDGERLTITGRLDDVVITGGEKVSLGLVERVVQALPGLADAVVVRAPDPEWGEVPVVATATRGVDLAVVRDRVADELGRRAAPRRLLVLDPLPLLPNGKPDRVAIAVVART